MFPLRILFPPVSVGGRKCLREKNVRNKRYPLTLTQPSPNNPTRFLELYASLSLYLLQVQHVFGFGAFSLIQVALMEVEKVDESNRDQVTQHTL